VHAKVGSGPVHGQEPNLLVELARVLVQHEAVRASRDNDRRVEELMQLVRHFKVPASLLKGIM
jgi:hypothetical protein